MKQRKPKERPRPQSPGFDMAMAALVVILEDEGEDAKEKSTMQGLVQRERHLIFNGVCGRVSLYWPGSPASWSRMPQRRKGHAFPYFKVQALDTKSLAWRDYRREAFDTLDEARAFQSGLPKELETRIMRWDERGATIEHTNR